MANIFENRQIKLSNFITVLNALVCDLNGRRIGDLLQEENMTIFTYHERIKEKINAYLSKFGLECETWVVCPINANECDNILRYKQVLDQNHADTRFVLMDKHKDVTPKDDITLAQYMELLAMRDVIQKAEKQIAEVESLKEILSLVKVNFEERKRNYCE